MLEYFAWTMLGVVFAVPDRRQRRLRAASRTGGRRSPASSASPACRTRSTGGSSARWPRPPARAASATSPSPTGSATRASAWARTVGAIPSAVGGHEIQLSHVGKVFPATPENLARWREWLRYVHADQIWVWGAVLLPRHVPERQPRHGHHPARARTCRAWPRAPTRPSTSRKIWPGFWFLTLFNGFWILFKTQLGNTDILVRTVTDAVWMSSRRARGVEAGHPRRLLRHPGRVLGLGRLRHPRRRRRSQLFKVLANMAGLVLADRRASRSSW